MTEIARHVIGIQYLLELRRMTLVAIDVTELVVAVQVTGCARYGRVASGQGEMRQIMIECCGIPSGSRMACLTCMAEITCDVIRIGRLLEIRLMTLIAT